MDIKTLEFIRDECLERRENVQKQLSRTPDFLNQRELHGRLDTYKNIAAFCDACISDQEDLEREREVS